MRAKINDRLVMLEKLGATAQECQTENSSVTIIKLVSTSEDDEQVKVENDKMEEKEKKIK